ncbi:MAG: LAGLIDADG family homing endonuclease [Chloroflexota bacterium]|nr:LAGLIDADG family homing endonuclease [Chloroflexota bacterium]
MRIFLDIRYPQIIQECADSIGRLFVANEIGIAHINKGDKPSYTIVSVYNKHLTDLFPQHGEGKKYTRTIALEPWQQRIVDTYPLDFWRGLYHSDGSRFSNIVNGKDYPRYQFSNESQDILGIFMNTCDKLGLHYSTKTKRTKGYDYPTDVFVSKRKDVQFLDEHIGPKR